MRNIAIILFFLVPVSLIAQIDKLEYYIDTDPGVGMATDVPITQGVNIDKDFTIPTSTVGFHTLVIRTRDVGGVWSIQESRSFYVSQSNLATQANIVNVEYYIDTDPGYGAGISLGAFAATTIDINPVIPTNTLPVGFHTLYIRALDSDGFWGDLESRSFYISKSDLTTQANVVALEYYIDTDPGYGAGTAIAVGAATSIDINATILTNTLPSGFHTFHIRALDSDGSWGEVESRSFFIDAFGNGQIAGIEYFIDTDPGYGNGTNIPVLPIADSIDAPFTLATSALTAGNYVVGLRILDTNGNYGLTDFYNFAVCVTALSSFSAATVCVGTATTFTDTSTGVIAGDVYSWDLDGDLTEDSNTTGNQSFTFTTAGTYNATLTIDRLGCISSSTVVVTVEPVPVSAAGPDQSICNTTTTLAANTPSANESGVWSVFSGSATITSPTSPATTITGISTSSVELTWTLTNTLGGCSNQNNVIITANLPITVSSQSVSVDIGQTINIDVQTPAVVNAGDILTTTISINPTQGSVVVSANGTLDFTPFDNATISDSFTFRITNQCSNFDENVINISIINQAPVIDSASFSAPVNAQLLTFDLTTIISDPNNNIDFSSLRIVTQPKSGAFASIDGSGILTIDYTGITFSGDDQLDIEICDLVGVCTVQTIVIPNVNVGGENPLLTVFNAVSPNNDGIHDFLEIENIEFYPKNVVIILNRWGDEIAKFEGYDNQDIVFEGKTLPAGTYYYHVLPGVTGVQTLTGFFLLKYD